MRKRPSDTLFRPEDIYLTLAEVAELLSISDKTARNLCKSGELKAKKIGGVWRCKRSVVDEYMDK